MLKQPEALHNNYPSSFRKSSSYFQLLPMTTAFSTLRRTSQPGQHQEASKQMQLN